MPPVFARRRIPFVLTLLGIAAGACLFHANRDCIEPVAPGVFLSWDRTGWAVLDNRHEQNVGFDGPMPGGTVVIDCVCALAKQGNHLVGTTEDGTYFIMALRPLARDEPSSATVTTFTSEQEWRARMMALGLCEPALREPADVAVAP